MYSGLTCVYEQKKRRGKQKTQKKKETLSRDVLHRTMLDGSPTSMTPPIESKLSPVTQQYDPRTNPFCSRPHRRTPKKLQTALLTHQATDNTKAHDDQVFDFDFFLKNKKIISVCVYAWKALFRFED